MPSEKDAHDVEAGAGLEVQPEKEKVGEQLSRVISSGEEYSIYSTGEKHFLTVMAALAALFSPLSASIYYSALTVLAADFHTTLSKINLTITTYLICQGLAPTFVGSLSDSYGRRPLYLACFTVYICACIGLALDPTYAGLLVLRMLQSSGSSGTVALANAVVSDLVTSAQRGSYISYVSMGALVGPAFGPVIGGLLTQYLGWRAIFWFLAIFAGVTFVIILVAFPETCRRVVGNGSVSAPKWNTSLISYIHIRKQRKAGIEPSTTTVTGTKRPSIIQSIYIIFDKESGIVLFYAGLFFAGFYMVQTLLPGQLQDNYGYSTLHIGLCYIPAGLGSFTAAFVMGRFLDFNFRRHAKKLGMEISNRRQQDLRNFPIEKARLEVVIPMAFAAGSSTIAFGWCLKERVFIAGPLVFLYLSTFSTSSAFQGLSTLIVDLNRDTPSSATAAMNLARCWLGAAGTAVVVPMINAIGIGWVSVFVAGMWVLLSPIVILVMRWGPGWREEKRIKRERKDEGNPRAPAAETRRDPAQDKISKV